MKNYTISEYIHDFSGTPYYKVDCKQFVHRPFFENYFPSEDEAKEFLFKQIEIINSPEYNANPEIVFEITA